MHPVAAGKQVPWTALAPVLGPACLAAVTSIGWSVGEALLMPFLLERGVSASLASLVFVVNPLVGLFLNTGCGLIMDRCVSMLIFVLGLQLMSVGGLGLVAVAGNVTSSPGALLGVVLVGYGAADLSHDIMAAPTRAIVLQKVDACVGERNKARMESKAHALVSIMLDVGRVAGLGVAAVPWTALGVPPQFTHLQVCITVSLALNSVLVVIACLTSGQRLSCAWRPREAAAPATFWEAVKEEVGPLWSLPRPAQWVLWLVFLAWILGNSLAFYWTSWMSTAVFPGAGETAVRWGALGMVCTAFSGIATGLALPRINAAFGTRRVLVGSLFLGAAVAVAMAVKVFQTLWGSLVLAALFGVLPAAATVNAFPLLQEALAGHELADQHATLAGLTNTCMVMAQLVGTAAASGILSAARLGLGLPCTWHLGALVTGVGPQPPACGHSTSIAFLLALYGAGVAVVVACMATCCAPRPARAKDGAKAPLLESIQ